MQGQPPRGGAASLVLPVRTVEDAVTELGGVQAFPAVALLAVRTQHGRVETLVVIPLKVLLQSSQQPHVELQEDAELVCRVVVHPATREVLGVDAETEAGLEVPVGPLLHLPAGQSGVGALVKPGPVVGALQQGGLVLPALTVNVTVTNICRISALLKSTTDY